MSRRPYVLFVALSLVACGAPPEAPPPTSVAAPPPSALPLPSAEPTPPPPTPTPPAAGDGVSVGTEATLVAFVHTGDLTADPASLSREVVRRVVRRHIGEIRFCYEGALATAPELAGDVTLAWIIGGAGATEQASVASSTLRTPTAADAGAPVEACLLEAIGRWRFPEPEGHVATHVTVPLTFGVGVTEPPPPAEPTPSGEGTIGLGRLGTVGS